MSRTVEFQLLERYAYIFRHYRSAVDWLKTIGIIPPESDPVKPSQVKLELDPKSINTGYLASVAYEWDSWGKSSPQDFVDALRCELKGSTSRDAISQMLVSLGRQVESSWT